MYASQLKILYVCRKHEMFLSIPFEIKWMGRINLTIFWDICIINYVVLFMHVLYHVRVEGR